MKTHSKAYLIQENKELSQQVHVRDLYLSSAFQDNVTHVNKGRFRLSICCETSANGGVVVESFRESTGKRYVVSVQYWEAYYQKIRAMDIRSDDQEGQDLRTCAESVARHVAQKQADYYAPRVAQEVNGQS